MSAASNDGETIDSFLQDASSTWNSSALLKTLNYAFQGGLTQTSPRHAQPEGINIPLKPHQLALIHAMESREEASLNGLKQGNIITYSNFGIIGDSVGTGKSLVILSHIAQLRKHKQKSYTRRILHPLSIPNFFSVFDKTFSDSSGNNLIVVPHTLYRQWQTYITTQTSLDIYFVKSTKTLNTDSVTLRDKVGKSDATIVSNTLYSEFMQECLKKSIHWRRIFWDEADTMHIPSTAPRPEGCFNWFITATWSNFILDGHILRPYLLGQVLEHQDLYHPDFVRWLKHEIGLEVYTPNEVMPYSNPSGRIVYLRMRSANFLKSFRSTHSLRGITILRTSDAFLEVSRTMPPINELVLKCKQPAIQRAMSGIVSAQVQAMLHAGDIEGVLEHLGVPANSPMSLLEAVNSQREKELDRLRKTLAFKESLEYSNPVAKELAINSLKMKITSLEEQSKSLKTRLEGIKDENCPICYDEPKSITLTPCCSHIFCGECVISSLVRNPSCPLCRTPLSMNQLTRLTNEHDTIKKPKIVDELLTKPKQLLKFLKDNATAKILVFCRYDNPFSTLALECEGEGIQYTILKGNKDCIANTVKQFESGEKRVLFLPTESAGVGMNLVAATHVVLLHVMTPEEERQVIGRAYRLGRSNPLTVVRLVHDGE